MLKRFQKKVAGEAEENPETGPKKEGCTTSKSQRKSAGQRDFILSLFGNKKVEPLSGEFCPYLWTVWCYQGALQERILRLVAEEPWGATTWLPQRSVDTRHELKQP